MSRRWDPSDIVIQQDQRTASGYPFEAAMTEPLTAYAVKNGFLSKVLTGTLEDKNNGTDIMMFDKLGLTTMNAGILRMDVTHNFINKDNMPLVWEPTPGLSLRGQPIQVGIRTGNKTAGFEAPVVVLGVDMPRQDVNCQLSLIRRETAKNAGLYLAEAGEALAAYIYMTDPRYAAYLENELDSGNEDLFIPDTSRLHPNYGGKGTLHTGRKSAQTISGISLARSLATEQMAQCRPNTEDYKNASKFLQSVKRVPAAQPMKRPDEPGYWMQQLAQYQAKVEGTSPGDSLGGPGYNP